jgi:cation:H+ antiporter
LRLGLTPLVVGLTVVAMGTSMPEVMVSVKAAMQGRGYLAVGNVIGSNIFNILAILGAGSLVAPLVAPDIRALDIWSMVGISALLLPVLWTGLRVTRGEGAMLLGCYGVYLFFLWPK